MSKAAPKPREALVNVKTGQIVPLHPGNQNLRKRRDMRETMVIPNDDGPGLIEVGDDKHVTGAAASNDLTRIGRALLNLRDQREMLLTAALKQPDGEAYLMRIGAYDGEDDNQYIDAKALETDAPAETPEAPKEDKPAANTGVEDVTEELEREHAAKGKKTAKRSGSAKEIESI